MPDIQEEIRTELKRIAAESGTVNSELRQHVDNALDRVMTALRRSVNTRDKSDLPRVPTEQDRAFDLWLRKGQEALTPELHKALTVGSDPSGGYLAPSFFSQQVEQYLRELSPIVQRARPITFGAGEADLPRVTSGTSATWVGELEQRPETELKVGLVTLRMDELACFVDVSQRLLEDSAINIDDLSYWTRA